MKPVIPLIKNLMTAFPYSIDINAPLSAAQELMTEHKIRHLPVRAEGELVGVLSDRELSIALAMGALMDGDDPVLVKSVCTPDPITVDTDAPVTEALSLMSSRHIGCVLVVKGDKLAGIFTTTDVCLHYKNLLMKLGGPIQPGTEAG